MGEGWSEGPRLAVPEETGGGLWAAPWSEGGWGGEIKGGEGEGKGEGGGKRWRKVVKGEGIK